MDEHRTASDIARELSDRLGAVVRPRDISDLFYRRELADQACPIVGGRRLIPRSLLPAIERLLRQRGLIPAPAEGADS